jgi:hypothetical protein
MSTRIGLVTIMGVFVLSAIVAAQDKVFVVRYLSAENVYLNGGSADGLAVGHRLLLTRNNECTTELEVVFVAEHSASCTMTVDSCGIAVGDRVKLTSSIIQDTIPALIDTVDKTVVSDSMVTPPPKAKSFARPAPPKVTGSAAFLLYYLNDQGSSNLDFTQATARLNLKARRLFDREITLNLRTRGRYDQRQRAYNSQVERNAWENRIWEMSLTYDSPHSSVNMYAGRILPRRVASAGYLDGLLVENRLTDRTHLGVFAGSRPSWAYDASAVSLQKAGGYITFVSGEPGHSYLEQTLAGIGEYHAFNVSRELVSLQGRFDHAAQWGGYHTIEIDFNRSWRKEKTGESFTLSSVYLGGWCRITPGIRANISYDNRVNYWSYDTRNTVDSLFDDHLRQGVRGQLDIMLPAHFQSSLSYGLRKRQGDTDPTRSYSVNVNKSGLWRNTTRAFVQYAGFDGPFEHGYNYSARLSDFVTGSLLMGIGYGAYSYIANADLSHRTSNWYEITGQADLGRRYFLSLSAQQNSGDDIDGLRLQSEIGWRF